MIQAQLPDGTALQFPDGTADAVIDQAVSEHVKTAPPQDGAFGYAAAAPKQKPPPAADIADPRQYNQGIDSSFPAPAFLSAPTDASRPSSGIWTPFQPPTPSSSSAPYSAQFLTPEPGAGGRVAGAAREGFTGTPDASIWAPGGLELGKYIVNPLLSLGLGVPGALFRGGQQTIQETVNPLSPSLARDLAAFPEAFPTGDTGNYGVAPGDPAFMAEKNALGPDYVAGNQRQFHRNQFAPGEGPPPPQLSPAEVRAAIPPDATAPQQAAPPQAGAPTHMYQGPDAVYPVTPTGQEQVFPDGRVYAEVHEPGQPPTWVPKDRLMPNQGEGAPVRQEPPPPPPPPEPDIAQPPVPTIPPAPRNALAPDFVGPEAPQPVNASAPQTPQPPAPTQPVAPVATPRTAAEAKQVASQYYTAADKAGGTLTPQFTNRFIDSVADAAPQTEAGAAVAGVNPITALVDRLQTLRDKPMTLAAAQEVDEGLGNLIDGEYGIKGLSKDGYKLQDIQHSLRDQIANAGEGDTTGGTAGFAALGPARKAWSQAMKMGDLERIQVRAALTDNEATSVKTQVRNIISNPVKARGYTPAELSALKTAANRGAVGSVMHVFGSRLVPLAVGAAGLEHGFMGAVLGGGLSHVGTGFARDLAGHIQQSRLNRAIGVVGRGVPPPP